jgi:pyruvate/2-oxoglutarate dehydrogenase complex dihydrolipoamide dehydrogenase (E3) component
VEVIEAAAPLAGFDREAADLVIASLKAEGVAFRIGAKAARVSGSPGAIVVTLESGDTVTGTHLLVAVGRTVNTDGLDLEKGNVAYDRKGISIDPFLRSTSNRRVWAVGDIAEFTDATGKLVPQVAQGAIQEGRLVANNLLAELAGTPPQTMKYLDLGYFVGLGKHLLCFQRILKKRLSHPNRLRTLTRKHCAESNHSFFLHFPPLAIGVSREECNSTKRPS